MTMYDKLNQTKQYLIETLMLTWNLFTRMMSLFFTKQATNFQKVFGLEWLQA